MSTQAATSALPGIPESAISATEIQGREEIPPLENGDRLTRPEYERRYNAMPNHRAQLIEGIVYMASPVSHRRHGSPHARVLVWLGRYADATPGVEEGAESSLRLDLDNMPEPDAFLYIAPELGGRIRIAEDDIIVGSPELVVEIASSSKSFDLHAKLQAYRRNGTPEYVVWRTRDRAIDWFLLRDGEYIKQDLGADGLYRSEIFPGLWLDPAALMKNDRQALIRVNQQGVNTPEHAAFVDRLKPRQA